MDQIVSDVYSLIGDRMRPGILNIATDDQTMPSVNGAKSDQRARELELHLSDWSRPGRTRRTHHFPPIPTELLAASGCAAFHTLLIELRARIEANENAPGGRSPSFAMYYSIVDPTQLAAGDVYWDDPKTPRRY